MWKKKIMLLFAVILSLCLAGCGSEKGMKNGGGGVCPLQKDTVLLLT